MVASCAHGLSYRSGNNDQKSFREAVFSSLLATRIVKVELITVARDVREDISLPFFGFAIRYCEPYHFLTIISHIISNTITIRVLLKQLSQDF